MTLYRLGDTRDLDQIYTRCQFRHEIIPPQWMDQQPRLPSDQGQGNGTPLLAQLAV